jgi:hypothetical protein
LVFRQPSCARNDDADIRPGNYRDYTTGSPKKQAYLRIRFRKMSAEIL